ncbi:MAG: YihY/virulence factor BrkB family protein [Candidatus Omnitrophota bacterium]
MAEKILRFFNQDIWRVRARDLKGPRGIGLRTLRIIILSVRQFASDKCSLHASALTFYSLLSIVPVFAMAFGLAKGFGLDRLLKEKLLENTQGQGEVMMRVMEFSEKFLQNTNGGLIAGIGIGLLFWTVINVLASIESSFNDVWGIKKQRTLGRKFADYLSLMLIAPVFFLMASSATVFIASQVQTITAKVAILGGLGTLIMAALQFMPYVIFWALLTYLYMFIPNGKIHFRSALLGGVVAGTIYQFVQWVYIHFQIGVSNAGAIYGSFAALPLFLIWLQLSWRIILYGAELAFAHQNEQTFEFEADCLRASYELKKLVALRMTHLCVRRFAMGLAPLDAETIASNLRLPVRLARELLSRLTEAGILSVTQGQGERDRLYQPGRDTGEMTVHSVIAQLEKAGTQDIPMAETPELEELRGSLRAFDCVASELPSNLLLKDLGTRPSERQV